MLGSAVCVALIGGLLIVFGNLVQLLPVYLGPDLSLTLYMVPLVFVLGLLGFSAMMAIWGMVWLVFDVYLSFIDKLIGRRTK
ncbi:hypothetical protein RA27_16020 [Ruegeria sp. ANG-R]|nr:hypothetical protein RA27_16020 [Ruegeria sp. ANG-R]